MDASALIGAIISTVVGLIGFYIGWTSTRPKPQEKQKEGGKDEHSQKAEKAGR